KIRSVHHQGLDMLSTPYRRRLPIRTEIRQGRCFLEAIRTVIYNGHDLVIKTVEDPDFLERLFGSTDMHLLRKCPCPLWLLKPSERTTYRSIIAAVDFNPLRPSGDESELNQKILELAASQALADFADLHLVHSWQVFGERLVRGQTDSHDKSIAGYVEKEELLHRNGLRQLGERLRAAIGNDTYSYLSPTLHVLKGTAHHTIPKLAQELDADLVVMGTLARTGIAGLLIGNTAETILEQLRCSVLAVKPDGFVSPVAAAGSSSSS
ncbi:MAG: universal stress protein, partial [Desulfofustis sp.]|nr:universal stress protein [Desulfofustis sp.]